MFRQSLRWLVSAADIQTKLTGSSVLQPTRVAVKDVSQGCGSFFHVEVVSSAFEGKPLVQQHRLVNEALREEIKQIHGLTIVTKAK